MLPKIYNATINLRKSRSELAVKELMASMINIQDVDTPELIEQKTKYLTSIGVEIDYLKSKIVKQEKRVEKLSVN